MQKQLHCFLFLILLLLAFVPAFAADSPKSNDVPQTVLDAASVTDAFSGLKSILGSVVNAGFILLGITASVFLIGDIFHRLVLRPLDSLRKGSPVSPAHRRNMESLSLGSDIREARFMGGGKRWGRR